MTVDVSHLGLATAFAAGTISFLSLGVLPLVPGNVSYVAGQNVGAPQRGLRTLGLSLCFVFGFSTIFIAFGAGASALASVLHAFRFELNLAGGAVVILFGLFTTRLVRLPWLQRELRWHGDPPGRGPAAGYPLGMAFAFGWKPCIGPVLGAILVITASTSGTSGVALLATYSLGLSVPFVLAALFWSGFSARLRALRWTRRALQFTAGGVMIAMGALMITGHMAGIAIFFLDLFPVLGRIG